MGWESGDGLLRGQVYSGALMPPQVQSQFNAAMQQGDALFDAGDFTGAEAKYDDAARIGEPYRKKEDKKEEEKKKPPPPTGPNPHPPEFVVDHNDAVAISTAPDVCRVGSTPTPFMSYALGGDDENYSSDVFSNGVAIKHNQSRIWYTRGDEPGTGLGVKSNTVSSKVIPNSHSSVVKVNGIWVQRHSDTCWLNNGNNPGEYTHVKSTEVNKAPDATDEQDKTKPKPDTRGAGERFADGFNNNASETWDGVKQVGSDLWDGTTELGSDLYNDPLGTLGSGVNNAGDAIGGAADWTGDVAGNLWDDPSSTLSRGWDNTTGALGSLWKGVSDPYKDAYARGGVAEALGHGTFDAVKLAVEAVATKGAVSAAGKTLGVGSKIVRAGDKLEDAGDLAEDAKHLDNVTEDGAPGARSTRKRDRRREYLGNTPDKYSRTGREVRERMREEGDLITDPETGKDMFKAEDGNWYEVDSPNTHMGHHPVDAVDYWNETGINHGAKSPEVRAWMLNSNNYRFEYGPLNSARGGGTTSRYIDP